jgi:hypothetical protein
VQGHRQDQPSAGRRQQASCRAIELPPQLLQLLLVWQRHHRQLLLLLPRVQGLQRSGARCRRQAAALPLGCPLQVRALRVSILCEL